MGLFDKFISAPKPVQASGLNLSNEEEAWMGILYGCGSIDGDMSDAEIDNLSNSLVRKTRFDGIDLAQS